MRRINSLWKCVSPIAGIADEVGVATKTQSMTPRIAMEGVVVDGAIES